jgi:hypothetical protein
MPEIPTTLEEAVQNIVEENCRNDPRTTSEWSEMNEREAIAAIHHSAGQCIRNNWGLWTGGPLALHFHARFGLTHADDMSGLILTCVHRQLCGLPWYPESEVARYERFWAERGGMPKPPWEEK